MLKKEPFWKWHYSLLALVTLIVCGLSLFGILSRAESNAAQDPSTVWIFFLIGCVAAILLITTAKKYRSRSNRRLTEGQAKAFNLQAEE